MQHGLLIPEPALFVQDEVAGHAARDEGACAALREVGLERNRAYWPLQVEDMGFGICDGKHGDLS